MVGKEANSCRIIFSLTFAAHLRRDRFRMSLRNCIYLKCLMKVLVINRGLSSKKAERKVLCVCCYFIILVGLYV